MYQIKFHHRTYPEMNQPRSQKLRISGDQSSHHNHYPLHSPPRRKNCSKSHWYPPFSKRNMGLSNTRIHTAHLCHETDLLKYRDLWLESIKRSRMARLYYIASWDGWESEILIDSKKGYLGGMGRWYAALEMQHNETTEMLVYRLSRAIEWKVNWCIDGRVN